MRIIVVVPDKETQNIIYKKIKTDSVFECSGNYLSKELLMDGNCIGIAIEENVLDKYAGIYVDYVITYGMIQKKEYAICEGRIVQNRKILYFHTPESLIEELENIIEMEAE